MFLHSYPQLNPSNQHSPQAIDSGAHGLRQLYLTVTLSVPGPSFPLSPSTTASLHHSIHGAGYDYWPSGQYYDPPGPDLFSWASLDVEGERSNLTSEALSPSRANEHTAVDCRRKISEQSYLAHPLRG